MEHAGVAHKEMMDKMSEEEMKDMEKKMDEMTK